MNVARNVAEVLSEHTTLELECIDRLYPNAYVPMLQSGAGTAYFFRKIRGNPVPSSALMAPMLSGEMFGALVAAGFGGGSAERLAASVRKQYGRFARRVQWR